MAENYFYSSLSGQEIENRLLGGVLFNTDQTLTSSQKAVARANIGAGESNSTFKVLGYFNTLEEMQAALQTLPKLGDAYGIGTESPYDVYVYAMHMVDGQAVPGWVNQGPIDTSAAAFDDEDISTRTGWTSSKIASELTNVQRRLVIDDVPTLGSGNPVASGGVAVKMEWKKIVSENVSVPVNRWTSSTKYDGYGFRAQIPIENVTADMIPEVIFDPADVSTGTFATIAESYNGGIYIYASEVPSAAITIPTIIVWRGDTGDGSDIPVIRVDPTLTVSGAAADAKATGDAIRANTTAIDVLQTTVEGKAGALIDNASGAIASFVPDSTIDNLLGVSVAVEPVQDLHGYDAPWPGGGGKNKFDVSFYNLGSPWSNVSGVITNAGSPLSSSYVGCGFNGRGRTTLLAGTYTLSLKARLVSGEYTAGTFNALRLHTNGADAKDFHKVLNPQISNVFQSYYGVLTLEESYTFKDVNLQFSTGLSNAVFEIKEIQIELGTAATAWTPYSNFCPISGRTGLNVWDDPKYGGTVAWNQLLPIPSSSNTTTAGGVTATDNRDGSYTLNGTATSVNANVWFYGGYNQAHAEMTLNNGHVFFLDNLLPFPSQDNTGNVSYARDPNMLGEVRIARAVGNFSVSGLRMMNFTNGATYTNRKIIPMLFDLTQMFGSTIADYIYSLEQATSGAGVAWFRNLFFKDYYPYNAGEITCVSAVNGDPYTKVSVDWQTEAGTVYGGTLDVTNGTMTVDRAMFTWTSTSGGYVSTTKAFCLSKSDVIKIDPTNQATLIGAICDKLKSGTWAAIVNNPNEYSAGCVYGNGLAFRVPGFTTTSEYTYWLADNPLTFVYLLNTPITITLDPVTISTISGQTNNVWADAGDVSVEYAADIKAYIDRLNQPTEDDMIANTLIDSGKYFTVNNRLFISTASIAAGAQIIPGTNCTETSLVEALNALNA